MHEAAPILTPLKYTKREKVPAEPGCCMVSVPGASCTPKLHSTLSPRSLPQGSLRLCLVLVTTSTRLSVVMPWPALPAPPQGPGLRALLWWKISHCCLLPNLLRVTFR